jgi:NAD-reducing hydrogenase large subunit
MSRRIVIDPVTRIEGHARVTIELAEDGQVLDARVQVAEIRGFESICVGRPLREMPALTARICGICPVSHSLAAARAGDLIVGADPPPAARKLRHLMQLAQLVQSHALSFFHLSAPDFVAGLEGDPARRNLLGLHEAMPGLAIDGVGLRRLGQEVIAEVGGRRVHPAFAVPGGVIRPLEPSARDRLRARLPGAIAAAGRALDWWKRQVLPGRTEEAAHCGSFESLFMALVGPEGELSHAEGRLRIVNAQGELVADGLDPASYRDLLGETAEPWSYLKLPYYRSFGYPAGMYRVGPLARLNVATRCGTPRADRELREFRSLGRGAVLSTFHAHQARLVEILYALERMEELLDDPGILGREVLAAPGAPRSEGLGACEAPRGTLFHHYRTDADGLVTWANLLVASGQNALAMNRAVRQIAAHWLAGARLTEALLNRVEGGIRAFDPCLSCSAHADGRRWLSVRLVAPDGRVLDEAGGDTG